MTKSLCLCLVLIGAFAAGGDLKPVRGVPGLFEMSRSDAARIKGIARDEVPKAYGKKFVLSEGKLDVCSWEYANRYGLLRALKPVGADLGGEKANAYAVEPDSVAIDPQSGRVKFFADEGDTEVKVVGRARTPHGAPTAMAVHGDYAFLSNGEGGHNFDVIDATDIQHPYVCADLACGNYSRGITYCDGRVYYATSYTGIWIIEVSDPYNPKQLALWEPPGERLYNARRGFAYKNVLFAEAGGTPPPGTPEEKKADYDGTFIVDISDPTKPKTLKRLDGRSYWLHEERLYSTRTVEAGGQKQTLLDVYSLENPAEPKLVASQPWPAGSCHIYRDRVYCFVDRPKEKEHFYFLQTYSLDNMGRTVLLAEGPLSVEPLKIESVGPVAFDGQTLYLIHGQDLLVIDLSNPAQPRLVGKCWSGPTLGIGLGTKKLFCFGGATYWFGESGVWVIDISDPAKPRRGGYVPTGGEGQNNWIGLDGRVCLAGGEWGGHIWVTDVSDREHPRLLGVYFDRYFNGNNAFGIALGNYFYMDDPDGSKILDLRVWEPYLGKQDPKFKPLVFDTYEYNPEVVRGLMQVRHKPSDGKRAVNLYMSGGALTSKPFSIPAGDYVASIRYRGHRPSSHEAVRLMIIEKDAPVWQTGYLFSKGRDWVEETFALSIKEGIAEARAHLSGCDVTVDYVRLARAGGPDVIPNGDFERTGPSALQPPDWEVGGSRNSRLAGRAPAGMALNGVLAFEAHIWYLYSGRRFYVFDPSVDPAELLTPGGMLLPTSHNVTNWCVRGGYLYAVSAPDYLMIFDVRDLASPRLVGEWHRNDLGVKVGQLRPYGPSGWIGPHYGLAVSKGILLCGETYHFKSAHIHVFDVSNPRRPKWLTRFDVGTKEDAQTECWGFRKLIQMGIVAPLGIVFDGGRWLYTAEYWSGTKLYDLADPARPKLVYNEFWPILQLKNWEDRKKLIPEGFFYMPGYSIVAWCGGEVWGHHALVTRLSHCAVIKVPRVSQAPKKVELRIEE